MEAPDTRAYPASRPVTIMHECSQELVPVEIGQEAVHTSHRDRGRYREKYQGMKEGYEKALQDNEMLKQQLENITKKAQLLQDENILLLDHLLINDGALAQQWLPQGSKPASRDPYPPQHAQIVLEPQRRTPPPPSNHDHSSLRRSRRLSHSTSSTTNGNLPPHHHPSNGRRDHRGQPEARPGEYISMGPPQPYERPLEFIPHDANGRS